jgi:pimeloyl-ACP methyl ester carboxylesterase
MSRRVILLHGLWMPGAAMHWLAAQLKAAGFAPEIFSYHSVADGPDLAVPRLVELLQAEGEADIVAHSLGGLIALQALCEAPQLPVARVVCLGSPLTGSGAATGVLRWAPAASLLGPAGHGVVAEDARFEALRAELHRQPVHRRAGHPQPVQEDDAPAARRGHAEAGPAPASRRNMNSMSRWRPTGNSYSATLPKPWRA